MESADVDVLDDLLHDVEGEGEDFEDAEAFFDTDGDQDGEGGGDATTDDILSQLDAVTTLDEDETQVDNSEEFHDSTSAPSSPVQAKDTDNNTETSSRPLNGEEQDSSLLQEPTQSDQPPSLSDEDVVQAVLDLATDEDLNEHRTQSSANELEATEPTQKQESPAPNNVENEEEDSSGEVEMDTKVLAKIPTNDGEGDASVTELLDAVRIATPTIDNDDTDNTIEKTLDMPLVQPNNDSEDKEEASALTIVPPPAPTVVPVIIGSMNPTEDDSDDSDESQGEEDVETTALPPPLQLGNPDDDDEDVLEVDSAVVSSLQIEEKQRLSMRTQSTEQQPPVTKKVDTSTDEDNALLKALPNSKVDDTRTMDLSFGEEARVSHVTTLEPGSPFSDIHKMAGGSRSSQFGVDATFGISYQNMRKKGDEPLADEKESSYSLPSGPAFPDEREFENEMELATDLSFSVAANTSPSKCDDSTATAADDEFSFDIEPVDSSSLSEEILKARRESLEAKKRKEEEELMEELRRSTDEEKRLIANNKVAAAQAELTTAANEAAVDTDALSLTELHSMYKRGLGDQEVLMDEENKKAEGRQVPEVDRSTSVMGRIFSQPHGATSTIAEETNDDDTEGEDNAYNDKNVESPKVDDENAEDTKTITEKSEADETEWREIKLVQHRQSREGEESGSVKVGNSPEAVSRMSYAEAAGYYAETPDVMQHRDSIVSEDFPRGSCLTCLSRPRLTFVGAIEECDRVFCIAATGFDAHNNIVVGVLQTIYMKIMKTPRDVLLIGRHWEDIGFQGSDPSTDLRGCGVLSLLQMLYLVESYPDLAYRFHALSQHPTRHFPFACVLINVTLQCVVALRSGVLYPECNKQASVLSGMNRLYVALASQLHDTMQSRSDEIPLIMKDVLDRGRSNPSKVIDEAFDGTALRPPRPAAAASKTKATERKESDNNLEFTEIGLQSVDEE